MIVVVGLSHKTAPIEVRERLALPSEAVPDVLRELVTSAAIREALVVSTCNRVEFVVAGADGPRANLAEVARATREAVVERYPGVEGHLYEHVGRDAIHHLFRVAASLDSLVVGEPQILGQLKDAYDVARGAGTAGAVLHRVVPRALRAAKRVRSETTIGTGQVSVPTVAVDLGRQIFGDLSRHTAALVGSGDMGQSVARLLRQAGARLIVVGRNEARVRELSDELGAEPRSMSDLDATLTEVDVVVTTTSSPTFVVDEARVRPLRKARRGRSLFFIDLAVPRDVEPRVGELDGVFLYNVDDLSNIVAESLAGRAKEAEHATQIIGEEARSYDEWANAEQATPAIVALRERLRTALQAEVDRSLAGKLKNLGPAEREALGVMVEAALNKMLHSPTVRLRQLATDPTTHEELSDALAMLHDLFGLGQEAKGASLEPPDDDPDDGEATGQSGVREAS